MGDLYRVLTIAEVCHEANRAYCRTIGEAQPSWGGAPQWQRDSAVSGVIAHLEGDLTPEQSHQAWFEHKFKDGWKYGPVKDAAKKEHPCMVPYDRLPEAQKRKDHLFKAIVDVLR